MPKSGRGFTLIEIIIVISVTAIIAAMVAVFLRAPVDAYLATARRAEMTDQLDNALRRIGRELRLALPNSVRIVTDGTGSNPSLELLVTRSGGRYRAERTAAGGGDPLDFTAADSSFDVVGPAVQMSAGPPADRVVVYNLGVPGASAYAGDTSRGYAGPTGQQTNVAINAGGAPYPFPSPGNRFQVVEGSAVSYYCNLATGQITRHSGYGIAAAQPYPPGGTASVVAKSVTACAFSYDASVLARRTGLVTLTVTLSSAGEAVTLYHAVHVNNVP